jgi:hypothetical protein
MFSGKMLDGDGIMTISIGSIFGEHLGLIDRTSYLEGILCPL